ncbi:serine hydrolase family protein [Mycetocola manganoxydans]|uniref:Serine hydrolase family protein n=1 Tax=Mycetocola manganoxydans TaxID=699879 RepID=A0A3L6ZWH3_9MICO|nr:alpha/beta hydrolase [Mycetocola manganoxydans]RLP71462.1 serine hydrolase family protein [Mycetocola manganoxydans]
MPVRIVVAHGYLASPEKHWFPWLVEQFDPGVVRVPALPSPKHPRPGPWVNTLRDAVRPVDDDTILVAHSLGSITTLRLLEALPRPWTLRGLVIVSGFAQPLPNLPQLDAFTAEPVNFAAIAQSTRSIHVFGSDNDTTVAPPITAALANELGAPLTILPGGGHFVERQGCRSIPELLPVLHDMVAGG